MSSKHILNYIKFSTLKILDKRIETIDKQIGDLCFTQKSQEFTKNTNVPYFDNNEKFYGNTAQIGNFGEVFNNENYIENNENQQNEEVYEYNNQNNEEEIYEMNEIDNMNEEELIDNQVNKSDN